MAIFHVFVKSTVINILIIAAIIVLIIILMVMKLWLHTIQWAYGVIMWLFIIFQLQQAGNS
jgi:hypothetical protein